MYITRVLSHILILTIMFSNFAWAMDKCTLSLDEIDKVNSEKLIIQLSEEQDRISCDSSCVSYTKLFYINYLSSCIQFAHTQDNISFFIQGYNFSQTKPPTKPPKSIKTYLF